MFTYKSFIALLTAVALAITITACDLGTEIDETFASAFITAEFVDAETGEGIANTEVTVAAAFEGSADIIDQGFLETDEFGRIETPISAQQETVITLLQFSFDLDGDPVVVSEEVELVLSFEDPIDEVDLFFEIETNDDID
jgi:hypothetical protein